VAERLPEFEMHRMDLTARRGAGKGLRLCGASDGGAGAARWVSAVANAKSSTGRVDCLTRVITDDGTWSSTASPGLCRPALCRDLPAVLLGAGRTGAEAEPDPVPAREAVLSDAELAARHAETPLVDGQAR
jgi:dCTP deaminase